MRSQTVMKVGAGLVSAAALVGMGSPAGAQVVVSDPVSYVSNAPTHPSSPVVPLATIAKRGDRGAAVKTLQQKLAAAGFNPGTPDGIFGSKTQAAVSAFQSKVSLPATGVYDEATAKALDSYKSTDPGPTDPAPTMSVRDAQRKLTDLGFNPGPVDGLFGPKTRSALQAFQKAAGISVTGRIDSATVAAFGTYNGGGSGGGNGGGSGGGNGGGGNSGGGTTNSTSSYQKALKDGPFDPGPVDGQYGTKTRQAIWALEKLAGLPADGKWGDAESKALSQLNSGSIGGPQNSYGRRWVEVDLSQQVMMVYDPGKSTPILVSHVSSGSGKPWNNGKYSGNSITPTGSFTITRRISGWRVSSLDIGRLYNPLYFTGGIAFHGAYSVPDYPASHGCVRVPMHIAEYLPSLLPNGTPVVVRK